MFAQKKAGMMCAESDCAEACCIESHCAEEYRTEEYCAEELCTEENRIEEEQTPQDVELFIVQMAFGLIQGMITPEDIYEGMLEANCGNEEVARFIQKRAQEEATEYMKFEAM